MYWFLIVGIVGLIANANSWFVDPTLQFIYVLVLAYLCLLFVLLQQLQLMKN